MSVNIIVMFSGGMGSFAATERIFNQNTHLLFTDTLIEDQDLYRFLLDSIEHFYGGDLSFAKKLVKKLTPVEIDIELRKAELRVIQMIVNGLYPKFHWLRYSAHGEGVSPWDIFYNSNYVGNSRVAQCSSIIKQRLARDYVRDNFKKESTKVVLGIDWSESHRVDAPILGRSIHANEVLFPLCDKPYILKGDKIDMLAEYNIAVPSLYLKGAEHNNCGGFCVRGGQKHFVNLLEMNEPLYDYHARQERGLIEQIGKDVSILRRQESNVKYTLPLDELKARLKEGVAVDKFDIGGCGCFVTDDTEELDYIGKKWGIGDLCVTH